MLRASVVPLWLLLAAALACGASTTVAAAPPADASSQKQMTEAKNEHKPGSVVSKSSPPALCTGASCRKMSDLLPLLRFRAADQTVTCSCQEFEAARCFAPGCFPCDKACFASAPFLANEPGPFGTGLLCSSVCSPCCQKVGDPTRPSNSTCTLVGTTC